MSALMKIYRVTYIIISNTYVEFFFFLSNNIQSGVDGIQENVLLILYVHICEKQDGCYLLLLPAFQHKSFRPYLLYTLDNVYYSKHSLHVIIIQIFVCIKYGTITCYDFIVCLLQKNAHIIQESTRTNTIYYIIRYLGNHIDIVIFYVSRCENV